MTISVTTIVNAAVSHLESLGRFERVTTHEPKNAPGNGLSAAVWMVTLAPAPAASTIASTSSRLELSVRLYSNMLQEPQDEIDQRLLEAVDAVMGAYSGDFQLGGVVRDVDLLGAHGEPLMMRAGYLEQDKTMFRVMVITLPLIINDTYTQVA